MNSKIPEEWKIVKLGDIAELYRNSIIPSKTDTKPYIGLEHIEEDKLCLISVGKSSDVISNKYEFKKGQILFGKLRPYFRKVILADFDGICSTDIFVIKPKKDIDNKFLFYLMASMEIVDAATRGSTGTKMPRASWDFLEGLDILIPLQKSEQQKIGAILNSFDEKIKINKQLNQTLEAIAQALFKHWFIDFEFPNEEGKPYKSSGGEMVYNNELGIIIPKGWEVGIFSDIVEYKKDSLKPGPHLSNRKYVPIELIPMKKIGLDQYKDFNEARTSLIAFEKDDILFGAMRPYFHRVNIAPFSGITRTTVFVLRPKEKYYIGFALLYLNLESSVEYANAHSIGSTIPYAVWNNSLEIMPTIIPPKSILIKFNDLIYPLISKIRDTLFENTCLLQIRDLLLPRLMSGKIRISLEGNS